MKKFFLNEKVISLLFVVLLFVILEVASYFIYDTETHLETILSVLEPDSELFWVLKPNLNVEFQEAKVKTNSLGLRADEIKEKKESSIRIITMGASPTFGWGVEIDQSYPRQIERKVNKELADKEKKVEVINAGIIGYSSYQGMKLLKEKIVQLSPDIITVSYVVNDVDKYRFFRNNGKSDKDVIAKNTVVVFLERILYKSRFCKLLRGVIIRRLRNSLKGVSLYRDSRRVSKKEYEDNLNEIINFANENNIKVILLKMPVILPEKYENKSFYYDGNLRYENMIVELEDLVVARQWDDAIAKANDVLGKTYSSAEVFHYLGVCYANKNLNEKAKEYFQKAKEIDLIKCLRSVDQYNTVMQTVAEKRKILMVDVVKKFRRNSDNGDMRKFFLKPKTDFVHYSVEGHRIIGAAINDVFINRQILLKD